MNLQNRLILAAFAILTAAALHACTHSPVTVSDGLVIEEPTYPADWTQNPMAAVVYEPTDEGASRETL